ncbi:hypothetical protein DFR86_07345 [Acidianus sulfidivorans JP7]|uniref:Uncharacterized protein n=1 Tax=Acidianus sulfidivorans JP7 TaxID=619593 RepID=A0A2U9IMZ7_9CREN|nr:hypothetical protein [Acidianus sulfidivorans]AWR97380.1 hypothetical protein DFR86_07345 [Acidianus sulfidivorans JP7]
MILVKFEDGEIYSLTENGEVQKHQTTKYDIMIVSKISIDLIQFAKENNIKLFECNKSKNECLEELAKRLFPQCKSCKFM